ncbi:MAG: hypothetical protein EPO51_10335 [Phenylobacterium sp.]|uniref:sensor histidine kinase n=1 Tax=Phenylobacterium sp. TaxID=1871053 RepID=UPI00120ED5D7|nr:ATP-binding protein [Phenylobacterium sp.]TAJ72485.1 MAG: hypothetical protein EPO51_10335 [Phenylobacterium sp.]
MRPGHAGRNEPDTWRGRGAPEGRGVARSLPSGRSSLIATLVPLGVLVASVVTVRHLGVSLIPAVLVTTMLVVAATFGLIGAILAVAVCAAIYQVAIGLPSGPEARPTLIALAAGAGFVGLASDGIRRWGLAAGTGGLAAPRLLVRIGRLRGALAGIAPQDGAGAARLALRILLALASLGLTLAVAFVVRGFGEAFAVLAIALGVLLTAPLAGRIGGSLIGLAGGVMLAVAVAPVGAQAVPAAIAAVALAAMAGWIGGLRQDAQLRGHAMAGLIAGARALGDARHELDVRRELLAALVALGRGRAVLLEGGAVVASHPPGQTWAPGDETWREREMRSEDRVVGQVRWRYAPGAAGGRALDNAAHALIDLAASTLLRLRFAAEMGEMEEAARIEHLRTVLLDAVSHHFRSPLSGILGSVTSILGLSSDHDPAVSRKLLFIIKDQANRLSRYVDNFISVARLESGAVDVNLAEVSLEALVYDVWESLGDTGGARRFLVAHVDQAPLRTDPALLGQALGNVLENAIKYSPEGSTVEVTATRSAAQLRIAVANEGQDAPPADLERIFERFYRSRQVTAPGLGLGLYITRSLARVLGGDVRALRREGGAPGLIVEITLPDRGDEA